MATWENGTTHGLGDVVQIWDEAHEAKGFIGQVMDIEPSTDTYFLRNHALNKGAQAKGIQLSTRIQYSPKVAEVGKNIIHRIGDLVIVQDRLSDHNMATGTIASIHDNGQVLQIQSRAIAADTAFRTWQILNISHAQREELRLDPKPTTIKADTTDDDAKISGYRTNMWPRQFEEDTPLGKETREEPTIYYSNGERVSNQPHITPMTARALQAENDASILAEALININDIGAVGGSIQHAIAIAQDALKRTNRIL